MERSARPRGAASRSNSRSAPALTARAMTAFEKPASSASARGTPGCSATNAISASGFFPLMLRSPGSRARTRYSRVFGCSKCRSRRSSPLRSSACRKRSSAARSPARRASGWRSSVSSGKRSLSSSQIKRTRRGGTDGYRCGFGTATVRTSTSRMRGIAPASTTAPSASPSVHRYCSATKRARCRPVSSNARGTATRSMTARKPFCGLVSSHGAETTKASISRVPSGTRTTSPTCSASSPAS